MLKNVHLSFQKRLDIPICCTNKLLKGFMKACVVVKESAVLAKSLKKRKVCCLRVVKTE